jgi:mannose-6-phosphate isomerase-like protein (cupin superfamily)
VAKLGDDTQIDPFAAPNDANPTTSSRHGVELAREPFLEQLMISSANAEHYTWGQQCDGWHLARTADLSVVQERMPPTAFEVRHRHVYTRQFFFVLSGTLTIETAIGVATLAPLQGVEIAPGEVHQVFNRSSEDVVFLLVSQPSSHGDRVIV